MSESQESQMSSRLNGIVEYGVDLNTRTIFLLSDIDSPTLDYISAGIHVMQDSDEPISLILNSPGGSDDSLFYLYDLIQSSSVPVYTTVMGVACSAAALLLACGSYRYASENSWSMLHKGNVILSGDDDEIAASAEVSQKLAEQYWALFARHTKHSAEWWYKKAKDAGQLWLSPSQMKTHNMIDEIIKPAVSLPTIKRMRLRKK